MDCALDASAPFSHSMKSKFKEHLVLYLAWGDNGVDWRGMLWDLLNLWSNHFKGLLKKRLVVSEKDLSAYAMAKKVNPLLL